MKAALIAAGEGQRLRAGGIDTPKPLVPIAGIPMIDRILWALAISGVHEVACVFNQQAGAVEQHCRQASPLPLKIVRQTTSNSMESLFALEPYVCDTRFLLLTVDVVFGPTALPSFFRAAAKFPDADVLIAVHNFANGDRPLHVALDSTGKVTAIGADAATSPLVAAGFYFLNPNIFRETHTARVAGCKGLRDFYRHLRVSGYKLYGASVPKTVDVDRPEDITAAEEFVRGGYEC